MEQDQSAILVAEGAIKSIKLSLSTEQEICTYSVNDCPVTHPSQLSNPFLGLPLEAGKCESCGASENDKCEGHFGYIELPVPIYHPCHVSELRQLLNLICLKCLRIKKGKVKQSNGKENVSATSCYYCRDLPALSLKEIKTTDGAIRLELRAPPRKYMREGSWSFLDKYGFHHGGYSHIRSLLPEEVLNILKKISDDTRKKLGARGYAVQSGYVMKYLPVPPNCLYIPEFTDGKSIMSYDISIALLKKVLQKIEQIKRSRSGSPNFESHEAESCDLQLAIGQYIHLRGTTRGPQDNTKRFAVGTDSAALSTKQWLEKMRTLFISKGSGFSSRSVLTGDPYIGVDVVGLPSEVAKRITFEEQVTDININRLQEVVDKGLCLTYRDGQATYAITVGSKGHTTLKVGQTISRRIVNGDVVFLNRPPSTHKHSLQAFYVYVHDDHTVKINPLICSPLSADFDGDCVHIYYPQSLAAKAEALELFSVEKQLISSHTGKVNLQLGNDSLLALKNMSSRTMLSKESSNQLAMVVSFSLPSPAVIKSVPSWTITQIVQGALPAKLTCQGDTHLVRDSTVIKLDLDKESVQEAFSDLVSSILCKKGPGEALQFLNALQPLLMEFLLLDGFSVSLRDFNVPKALLEEADKSIQKLSLILEQSRCSKSQFMEIRVENNLKSIKQQMSDFVVKCSDLGLLIDPKKESSMSKVVQQLGFVGLQLYREGKLYSSRLVEDCFSNFVNKHPAIGDEHPPEAYGLVQSSYFHGLNPYEELVHAISTREAIVRSSRGLTEPGTLFKSLMAILRDVVICYDGTVRNICSNSIIQLKYKEDDETDFPSAIPPGEPVGVLAATAISNPAYKAVLDSSQSNNASWESMKEILLTKVGYKNDTKDRKVILFLNDCSCAKKFCKERAAIAVQGCLRRVTLADCATDICIERQKQISLDGISEAAPTLVGHIHLDKAQLERINISTQDILQKCQEVSGRYAKKKGNLCHLLKKITFATCDCSFAQKPIDGKLHKIPCLQFSFSDDNTILSESVERAVNVIADSVCSVFLDTIIKGDPRIQAAKIIWVESDATSWVKNTRRVSKGEPALEIIVEKDESVRNGDAWRTTMDACLPVINLIDTQRSIPYGIQQMRELLGTSCAFDQVVQRLSTTIKMVSKNVLKDHLILVANSMTCTGNLNGFNTGGYKATFRSLKVQVPFTESTLFTPMKCFEKAAEKCDSDSLGCVVSSCSWGKHAAIGTGSSFQILWNENQLKSNKEYGDGLYDFLALVRTDQEKAGYMFLDDVDYLLEENTVDDVCLSPELDGNLGKPTFEDNIEEQDIQKGSSWENGTTMDSSWEQNASAGNDSSDWGGWSNGAAAAAKQPGQDNSCWDVPATVEENSTNWGGWGTEKPNDKKLVSGEPAELDTWSDKGAKMESDGGGSNWEKKSSAPEELKKSVDQDPWGDMSASPSENTWDKRKGDGGDGAWEKQTDSCKEQETNVDQDSWANKTTSPSSNTWDKKKSDGGHGNWEKQPNNWNEQRLNVDQDSQGNAWAKKKSDHGDGLWEEQLGTYKRKKIDADHDSWGNMMAPPSSNAWVANEGDGRSNTKSDARFCWVNNQGSKESADTKKDKMETDEHSKLPKESDPWKTGKSNESSWEKANSLQDSWGNSEAHNNNTQDGSWDKMAVKDTNTQQDSWDNVAIQNNDAQDDCWDSVAAKAQPSVAQDSWGNPAPSDNSRNAALVSQGTTNSDTNQSGSWDGWNAAPEDSLGTAKWNKANDSGNNKGWKSDGWGAKTGNWRSERNNPGRPPRRPDERDPPMPRQRFELTNEEKNILLKVEPIVLCVRRIFREACVGVRLPPEDDKFIQEKVLEHHPEKQSKVSGEIDHIMVDKHQIFQDTRCFFVVSTDGSRSDFSYLKCMENFVRKNYTEDVDSFCAKYLRPRRKQAPAADGGTSPGTSAEAPPSTAAETEQGTPALPETQLGTPAPPDAIPQETLASPAAAPQDNPKPDSTGDTGMGPDLND
ncbi:DNA-directed RNA polymerase V subunit 1-like [Phragmites australis]|uniref:DNA-directed RNA polymerase V subunit 1-like n=1 Tax=Phragmites australis TaxID=29695 RepID=UPI002D7883FD|nr:DNA-directed RNA polymerase V subunit 1-like [Phragmites australis]